MRERSVRLVQDHRSEYPSLWVTVESIAPKIGCSMQTMLTWVKRHDAERAARRRRHRRAQADQGAGAAEPRTSPCQRHPAHGQRFFRAGGVRPQAEVINTYIDQHREAYRAEPISKVLQVGSSAYRRYGARLRDPPRRSDRARRDEHLKLHVHRIWQENHRVYGPHKVWRQLNRGGVAIARCTVERLTRSGLARRAAWQAAAHDDAAVRSLDRLNQQLWADWPSQLWLSDFTYVSTWQDWLYVAFVIDVYARRVAGWRASKSMTTDFVLDALEQA